MNYENCATTWFVMPDNDVHCSNCGKLFRKGERVRISTTGVTTFVICGNGWACALREQRVRSGNQ